jgi:integrase
MATASKSPQKPDKPYPGFPLTPHPNGQWCKKIRGRVHFFGVWADSLAALDEYNRQAADLHAGRLPRRHRDDDVSSVKDLANSYMSMQSEKVDRALITPTHFDNCLRIVRAFCKFVGGERRWDDLRPDDFRRYRLHLYDHYGVHAITRAITIVRSMFRQAYECDVIDRPVKYGSHFDKPSVKEMRKHRGRSERSNGKRLFTAEQLRALLGVDDRQLKAMILLGINGGFGNTDCAELPLNSVDWEAGVIEYERSKTGMQRTVPLWKETMTALRTVVDAKRRKPRKPEYDELVFLTKYGYPWKREELIMADPTEPKAVRQDAVSAEFNKVLQSLAFHRPGLGFYALRHTFRTWADETGDQHAIHRIMGHAIPGMSGIYVQEISIERLRAVVEHVHNKLFSE